MKPPRLSKKSYDEFVRFIVNFHKFKNVTGGKFTWVNLDLVTLWGVQREFPEPRIKLHFVGGEQVEVYGDEETVLRMIEESNLRKAHQTLQFSRQS